MIYIDLLGGNKGEALRPVLSALAESCGMEIRQTNEASTNPPKGFIILGDLPPSSYLRNLPYIHVRFSTTVLNPANIRFGTGPSSPYPFKGKTLNINGVLPGDCPADFSGEVIATSGGIPVWVTTSSPGARCDICWVSNPWIEECDSVFDHLNSFRLMNLLPIVEWLRWISGWQKWIQPPLRASFMFDDPNLHGTRYGFARYRDLASGGKRYTYHTSFATVPLDAYYSSSSASRIFKENGETLSLLIHGNNHTKRELAVKRDPSVQSAMMRQALQRIERLEKKAHVPVSRVMAPPHGVCSAEMMAAMVEAGFEAVCVSHGSVRAGNPHATWLAALGASATTSIRGLLVIPRFGLERKPENQVLLAAYLRQPIIPVGHHWDLADGLEILSEAARIINDLGIVTWTNLTTIARNDFCYKVENGLMTIRTFARKTEVRIPNSIHSVVVEANSLNPEGESLKMRILDAIPRSHSTVTQLKDGSFPVSPGQNVVFSIEQSSVQNGSSLRLRTPLRVIARRLLVETRDRSMPYLPRKLTRG